MHHNQINGCRKLYLFVIDQTCDAPFKFTQLLRLTCRRSQAVDFIALSGLVSFVQRNKEKVMKQIDIMQMFQTKVELNLRNEG